MVAEPVEAPSLSPELREKLTRVPVAGLSQQLRKRGLKPRAPERIFATPDHYVSTATATLAEIEEPRHRAMVEALARNTEVFDGHADRRQKCVPNVDWVAKVGLAGLAPAAAADDAAGVDDKLWAPVTDETPRECGRRQQRTARKVRHAYVHHRVFTSSLVTQPVARNTKGNAQNRSSSRVHMSRLPPCTS
jgi:hypothetical protein